MKDSQEFGPPRSGRTAIARGVEGVSELEALRLGVVLEVASDAVVAVDQDGLVVLLNARAEQLFGFAREELVGKPVELLVPSGARATHVLYRCCYVADPQPRRFLWHKTGSVRNQAPLGAGGMGEVYSAHDGRLDRTVAIKVLPASFSTDRDRLQRFSQEARAAAALNHPNILSIFDIGEDHGAPYVVSELLEGETLRDRLRSGPIPVR